MSKPDTMVTTGRLQGKVEHLPVARVVPNGWNPNEQKQEVFNLLCEQLKETGLVDPLQVVKLPEGAVYEIDLPEGVMPDDGDWWMLIGGEHRWSAARAIGWDEVTCVVLPAERFSSQDFQELMTVRMNMLRGELNPEKFFKLWEKHSETLGEEAAARMFGFTGRDVVDKLLKQVRKSLKGNVPDEVIDKLDKRKQEIRTVEDLSRILHQIMKDHGDQAETNLIVFAFGGKRHVYVRCSADTWDTVTKLTELCRKHEKDVNEVFGPALKQALAQAKGRAKTGEL